uniref:Uncharacterized protein n=1 Tax=Amphilophus citrinellus TaxID=61819 RepID=A0A3Q0THB2_AMPCI
GSSDLQNSLIIQKMWFKISAYKVKTHKSELLPLNVNNLDCITSGMPFKMATHSFVYLGIAITKTFDDLYKNNFEKLLIQVHANVHR